MDIRTIKTQEAIFDAFFNLLNERSFQQISVGQIIERARIGRSTFYSHFTSKDDLLAAVTERLFKHVFETSSYGEHQTQSSQPGQDSLLDLLTHLFQHFKENEEKVSTLFKLEDEYFSRHLHQQLGTYLVPLVLPLYFDNAEMELPEILLQQYITATFITCLSWWLHQKEIVTARAMSFYYLKLLSW